MRSPWKHLKSVWAAAHGTAARAHPVAADAEVAVAQLHGLLGAEERLLSVPIVHLSSKSAAKVARSPLRDTQRAGPGCGTNDWGRCGRRAGVRRGERRGGGQSAEPHQDEVIAEPLVLGELHSRRRAANAAAVRPRLSRLARKWPLHL